MFKEDGKTEYKYSVNEENVSGYKSEVTESEDSDTAGDGSKIKYLQSQIQKPRLEVLRFQKQLKGMALTKTKHLNLRLS